MIRNRLSELLSERGLKTSRVAKEVKIARSSLTSMIQNDTEMLRYDAIDKLCRYLHITPNDFFEYMPINVDMSIQKTKNLFGLVNKGNLHDLSEVLVFLIIEGDFLIDIEVENEVKNYDCILYLEKITKDYPYNKFIFTIKDEKEYVELKTKIDQLTPGFKKILFSKINNLIKNSFMEDILKKVNEDISFPEFNDDDKEIILKNIQDSIFTIESSIFTEY
ncbi:helix-turn-helix domain-containing protein [Staphylococcus simulans]|uniref:helix-turn-helix domain-containing protein n=1 Tax=Staphylococcus simulans TaxID=1286 RepID=UPI0021CFA454|nr:helix-turn-helix transcriptional regulator [Staphylococcus simulans]UXR44797.1 helix-turn-helix transcriptional regulator [Staphylococcus simulans]